MIGLPEILILFVVVAIVGVIALRRRSSQSSIARASDSDSQKVTPESVSVREAPLVTIPAGQQEATTPTSAPNPAPASAAESSESATVHLPGTGRGYFIEVVGESHYQDALRECREDDSLGDGEITVTLVAEPERTRTTPMPSLLRITAAIPLGISRARKHRSISRHYWSCNGLERPPTVVPDSRAGKALESGSISRRLPSSQRPAV